MSTSISLTDTAADDAKASLTRMQSLEVTNQGQPIPAIRQRAATLGSNVRPQDSLSASETGQYSVQKDGQAVSSVKYDAVSYTHLTLPTICSV